MRSIELAKLGRVSACSAAAACAVGLVPRDHARAAVVDEAQLTNVWVMPEGTDAGTVAARLGQLAGPVLARGRQLTPRLQILLRGDRRGV